MKNRLPAALTAMLVVLAVGGCSCDDPAISESAPRGAVSTTALRFTEICNDDLAHLTFEVTNTGTGTLVGEVKVVGSEAFFTAVPKTVKVGSGLSQTVTVTYHPTGEGEAGRRHEADVRITYTGEGSKSETLIVEVDGEASAATVAPQIAFACGNGADGAALPACTDADVPCCSTQSDQNVFAAIGLGPTQVGQTSVMPLRIENHGCGDLRIESMVLETATTGGSCDRSEVKLTNDLTPFVVSRGQRGESAHEFGIEFTPQSECLVIGSVTITSDSPTLTTYKTSFTGHGRMPQLTTSDSRLFYGEILPGTTSDKSFSIRNVGGVPVDVSEIRLKNQLGNTLDFSLHAIEKEACEVVDGTSRPSGNRTPVVIDGAYTIAGREAPIGCGDDELFVTVRYAPSEPPDQDEAVVEIITEEGVLSVSVGGGAQAGIDVVGVPADGKLFRDPVGLACADTAVCGGYAAACSGACENDTHCDAGDSCVDGSCTGSAACVLTCGTNTKTLDVCNIGVAPLRVSGFQMESDTGGPAPVDPTTGDQIFRVAGNTCVGNPVAAGACCQVEIGFKDKNTGGTSSVSLVIASNAQGQESFPVEILAQTTTDRPPEARVLVTPALPTVNNWVKLDALPSIDDRVTIGSYQWEMVASNGTIPLGVVDPDNPPANVRFPDGHSRTIEFLPTQNVTYEWRLQVTDVGCNPPHTGSILEKIPVRN